MASSYDTIKLQYFKPFQSAKTTNEGKSADFANFDLELVAMATSLNDRKKEGQIVTK